MGACVVTNRAEAGRYDNRRVVECDLALSSSYLTGGDSLSPSSLGLRHITQIQVSSHLANSSHRPVAGPAVATTSSQVGASIALAGTSGVPLIKGFDAQGTELTNASDNSLRGPWRVRVVGY